MSATGHTAGLVALLRDADGRLFPGADVISIAELARRARRDLQVEPPADYLDFLSVADGAVADGLMLYGTRRHSLDHADLPELVAINLRRRSYRHDPPGTLQLGEIDDDLIVFQSEGGHYGRLERTTGDAQATAATLHDLVQHLIGRA